MTNLSSPIFLLAYIYSSPHISLDIIMMGIKGCRLIVIVLFIYEHCTVLKMSGLLITEELPYNIFLYIDLGDLVVRQI